MTHDYKAALSVFKKIMDGENTVMTMPQQDAIIAALEAAAKKQETKARVKAIMRGEDLPAPPKAGE